MPISGTSRPTSAGQQHSAAEPDLPSTAEKLDRAAAAAAPETMAAVAGASWWEDRIRRLCRVALGSRDQGVSSSAILAATVTKDRVARIEEMDSQLLKLSTHRNGLQVMRRVWSDVSKTHNWQALPANQAPAPLGLEPVNPDNNRAQVEYVKPAWNNCRPGPQLVKMATAYQLEKSAFNSDWHRFQRSDNQHVAVWLQRQLVHHDWIFVSWLQEGRCAQAFARGQARAGADGPAIPAEELEAPPEPADVDRAEWMANNPLGLGFAARIALAPGPGPHLAEVVPPRARPARAPRRGRPERLQAAVRQARNVLRQAGVPVPGDEDEGLEEDAPVRGDDDDDGADGAAGGNPPRRQGRAGRRPPPPPPILPDLPPAMGDHTRLWIVPYDHIVAFRDDPNSSPWQTHIYVSDARTAQNLWAEFPRLQAGVAADILPPLDHAVVMVVPHMTENTVKTALALYGLIGWRVGHGIPLAELAGHAVHALADAAVGLCSSVKPMFPEDVESLLRLEADRRFRIMTRGQQNNQAAIAPTSIGLGVQGVWAVHHSSWVMRVAHVLGFIGTERDLVFPPREGEMATICVGLGLEMARWFDMAIMRTIGSPTNIALAPELEPIRDIISVACAAISLSAYGGGVMPAVPIFNFYTAQNGVAAAMNAGFTLRSRTEWDRVVVSTYRPVWDVGDVATSCCGEGWGGRFIKTSEDPTKLRNTIVRMLTIPNAAITTRDPSLDWGHDTPITASISGAVGQNLVAPRFMMEVPVEIIAQLWGRLTANVPWAISQMLADPLGACALDGPIATVPASGARPSLVF